MATQANPAVAAAPQPSAIQTQPPFIAFKTDSVPPSQFLYVQLNDWLTLNCLSNTANIPVVVKYRYLTPQSEIKEGTLNFNIAGTFGAISFQIGEGWLLGLSLQQATASPQGTFVHAQILITRVPVTLASGNVYTLIWQGYVPASAATGWPGGPVKDPTDGQGALRSITGSTPAAGADIVEVVPSNRRWNLLAFSSNLTASATVANRTPLFLLDDGSHTYFTGPATFTQTAGQVVGYSGSASIPSQAPLTLFTVLELPLPIELKTSHRIRTFTAGIQAGDQWAAPQYLIQEWGTWDF